MAQSYQDTAIRTPETPGTTIADPAPLGLAGFAFTTLLLSVINAGWIGAGVTVAVMAMAIAFGGTAQFVAGMWAFRRGNTFAATAFTSYGAFWLSFFLLVVVFLPQAKEASATDISTFVGTYLLGWGIFTAYMFVASLAGARAIQVVFALLAVTFIFLALGEYATSDSLHKIGGYLGLATAVAAIYASFADVVNANFKRKVLPT